MGKAMLLLWQKALWMDELPMIHYHGTPITPAAQIARMAGRHFCVSFARPDNLAHCLRIGQSLMFDNGAFSVFTRGEKPDWPAYYRWLAPLLAPPHWAVIPDVIDGDADAQSALIQQWPREYGHLGVPVWHLALSIDWLLELCDRFPRVCFGSSGAFWKIGAPGWRQRMDEAFNALHRTQRFNTWIHGLRMLGQTDGGWPLASADSTNVAQNHARTGCAECLANRVDSQNPRLWWNPRDTQLELIA